MRVVGTRSGADGELRQRQIKRMRDGEPVSLIREPDNRYDRSAIAVYHRSGQQLGYLKESRARHLAAGLDAGRMLEARAWVMGDADAYLVGLRLRIREIG